MTDKALVPASPGGGALVAGGAVEFNLDGFPVDKFNRLIPTQTVMTTDLLMPIVQVVAIDPPDKAGKSPDSYTSPDIPAGHRALTRRCLRKLAGPAGVSTLSNRRTDDGSNPDVCAYEAVVEMILPTGQRIRAVGTKRIDIRALKWSPGKDQPAQFNPVSSAQRDKFRQFFDEHCASKAENRAIRGLLSIKASYTDDELRKPFAVVSFVPNTNHPDVRAAMLTAMAGSVPALYGPEPTKQIGVGLVTEVEQAPDDDVVNGHCEEVEAEPDWFAAATPAAPTEAKGHRLERLLRDNAEASGVTGQATDAQLVELRKALLTPPDGIDQEVIRDVFQHIWHDQEPEGKIRVTAAQATAIKAVNESEGTPALRALWRELAAIIAANGGPK